VRTQANTTAVGAPGKINMEHNIIVPWKLYYKEVHSATDWMHINAQTMRQTILNNFMKELNLQFR